MVHDDSANIGIFKYFYIKNFSGNDETKELTYLYVDSIIEPDYKSNILIVKKVDEVKSLISAIFVLFQENLKDNFRIGNSK